MLQLFGRPTHLFDIPPEAFSPAPKISSSCLRFRPTVRTSAHETCPCVNPTWHAPVRHASSARLTTSFALLQAIPIGEEEPLSLTQRGTLLAVLKLAFESRRKMLRTSLRPLLESGMVNPLPEELLTKRPEQLSPTEHLELARILFGPELNPEGGGSDIERHVLSKAWRAHKAGWKD